MIFMAHATDPSPLIGQGTWEGRIAFQEAGDNGFGYDPVFYSLEHQCVSAELTATIKNRVSHRAHALNQLMPQITDYFSKQT
jgi:Xanthosine triphosphate pyrophosphatase